MAAEITKQATAVSDPAVESYVAELGEKLKAHIPGGPALPWSFSVWDLSDTDNLNSPVALPDGRVIVPVSLILAAQDEAEFAGMLAEAISHGPYRLPVRAGTLVRMGNWHGNVDGDRAAAQIGAGAGFNPAALVRYIAREDPNRAETLRSALTDVPTGNYASASGDFARIQALLWPPRTRPTLY